MLDLPSSDLDVVVLGLDHMEAAMAPSSPQNSLPNCTGSPGDSSTSDKSGADIPLPHHHSMPHYMPMPMNAERVVRLAAELDRHPWAVHVKAIPTATVPVVKVLADPSRLPGMVPPVIGEEYVPQHVQAPASRLQPSDPTLSPVGMPQQNVYQPEMAQPVWRGADVMNGLLSLDITFEGPEHGGIGSTEFSARAVQEVCNETGLVAEGTPFVQVIMVVKELLAQRRLNEPFSGGLSSYSLLLLVLAVVRERKVIREELERVERQRRVVAAGVGGSCVGGSFEQEKLPQTNLQQSGNKSDPASTKAADRPGNGEAPSKDKKKGSVSQHQADGKSSSKAIEKRAQSGNAQQGNSSQKQWASKAGQKVSKADPAPNHARDPQSTQPPSKKPSGGSWAYVAKGSKCDSSGTPSQMSKAGDKQKEQHQQNKAGPQKPGSFADAVARSQAKAASNAQATSQGKAANASASDNGQTSGYTKKINKKQTNQQAAKTGQAAKNEYAKNVIENASKNGDKESSGGALQQPALDGPEKLEGQTPRKIDADEETSKFNNYSSGISADPSLSGNQSLFPQGFNDVIEVLCSGDTTPGKLLMHFLLFYGQHFDAHATAIDISGKHHRDIPMQNPPYTHLSPYMQRRSAGTIDPVTGMLTVDPIVVYDPLEGAEQNNVARRCFLWSSVKWVFAQSYMTLSSAVEQNTTPSTTPGARSGATAPNNGTATHQHQETPVSENAAWNGPYNPTDKGNLFDPSSPHPLLELLLSF
mgnify:CR=1 FL=1